MRKVVFGVGLISAILILSIAGVLIWKKGYTVLALVREEPIALFEQPPAPTITPSPLPKSEPVSSPTPSATPVSIHPKPTISPKPVASEDLETALHTKYGAKADIQIEARDPSHAQGTIRNAKGKWWLAARDSRGRWKVVADGYSYVYCDTIASYSFPRSMVPSCWSRTKNTLMTL